LDFLLIKNENKKIPETKQNHTFEQRLNEARTAGLGELAYLYAS